MTRKMKSIVVSAIIMTEKPSNAKPFQKDGDICGTTSLSDGNNLIVSQGEKDAASEAFKLPIGRRIGAFGSYVWRRP
jgi:hypothetical protein